MNLFKASVQYGDWHGSAAADNANFGVFEKYLREKQLIQADEVPIAVSIWVSENSVFNHVYLFQWNEHKGDLPKQLEEHDDPIPVREVTVELSLEKFVAMFKIFNVVLTWGSLGEREYQVKE